MLRRDVGCAHVVKKRGHVQIRRLIEQDRQAGVAEAIGLSHLFITGESAGTAGSGGDSESVSPRGKRGRAELRSRAHEAAGVMIAGRFKKSYDFWEPQERTD